MSATNPFLHLEANALTDPSGVFFESFEQTVRNAEAATHVKKLAFELRRLGVLPGDLVALDLPETLSVLFTEAVFHEGAASAVLPRGYVADGSFPIHWLFSSAAEPTPNGATVVAVDSSFLQRVEQNPFGISPRDYASDDSTIRVIFSSGTTGTPKALEYSLSLAEFQAIDAQATWSPAGQFLTLFDTSTLIGFMALYVSARTNRPLLITAGASADAIARLIESNGVTSLRASPAQYASLVDGLEAQGTTLPRVASVVVAGAVMPPQLAARIRHATDGCEIINIYGSTEAGMAAYRSYPSDDPYDVGRLNPRGAVQIVDDNDEVVPVGQVGNIRHMHPFMLHRYLGDPVATSAAYRDGWFYCGDLGMIREDGGLTIAGRSSEVVNAGGIKFDPNQLDLFALTHAFVTDACSFGYVTAAGLEQIGIALVTEDGFDVQQLVAAAEARFGPAAPKLVARIDTVPRNSMGKPLRRELAQKYSQN